MIRIGIDLGKTSCRIRVFDGEHTRDARGTGAPGLSEIGGADAAMRSISETMAALPGAPGTGAVDAIGVGAAGALAAPDAAADLAQRIRAAYGAPALVTSDAVAAHAGAFAGAEGALLIVGTGAVAIAVTGGRLHRADGWGPWLGDEGSGQWIGRAGLRAALRARDGRGPHTALADAASALAGSIDALPAWLARIDSPAARVAQFAPAVLDAAALGDAVAASICDEAALALAATAAAVGGTEVVLHGGITEHDGMRQRLMAALDARGMRIAQAQGDACTGAADLALPGFSHYDEGITRA